MQNRKSKIVACFVSVLLIVGCSAPIVSVLEHENQKVKLSQIQRKQSSKVRSSNVVVDTTKIFSDDTEKVLKERYTTYDKDDDGQDIMAVTMSDINVVAKSKNIPERSGKICLDFKVTVPASLINNKWQIQLSPYADKNGKKIQFDKILVSGAQFLKQQERGYQMYQNFINSIIPDSAYMQHLFDVKGYQKALFDQEEQFYYAWQKDLLSQSRFVDWRAVRNKRNILFNGMMERNRSSVNPSSWKNLFPSYWLERNISDVPGHWNNFLSPDYQLQQKIITPSDSITISKRFFDYKRMAENERRKAVVDEKYSEFVKFPKEPCKLDTVIQRGDQFEYYYSQNIEADENIKKIDVMIDGEVVALDASRYQLPHSDTLTYYISSMVQFLDRGPKYKQEVISKHATADLTANITYGVGSSKFVESIGKNKEEIDKVLEMLHRLTFTGELVLDSVNMTATASPEGDSYANKRLSVARAGELKKYLQKRCDDDETMALFYPRAIGADWKMLVELVSNDSHVKERDAILRVIASGTTDEKRERSLRKFDDYAYLRKVLYPQLRAVKFNFNLHRREMIKDTIHTTVLDTAYMKAVELLENRQYQAALSVLSDYNDQNTAVCLMSLGYDRQAIDVLRALHPDESTFYLLAILYSRARKYDEAVTAFKNACLMDPGKWYRGQLDPEISKLITDYKLNFEQ